MANMMQPISIMAEHFRVRSRSPRIYMGFLLGMALTMIPTHRYLQYAEALHEPIQILEPFIISLSVRQNMAFLVLGLLLVLSDAPFMTRRTPYVLLRTSRRKYVTGSLLYVVTMSAAYFLSLLLFTACVVSKYAYFGSFWSYPMYQLTQKTTTASLMNQFCMFFSYPYITNTFSPFYAALHAFLLSLIYAVILGLIMFILNSIKGRVFGSVAALLVHAAGYVMMLEAAYGVPKYSLLGNALLASHENTVPDGSKLTLSFSYLYLTAILLTLTSFCYWFFKRTDFRISTGEGSE